MSNRGGNNDARNGKKSDSKTSQDLQSPPQSPPQSTTTAQTASSATTREALNIITPQRLRARKLAETAIQTILVEGGTLANVAEKLPEQFAHHQRSSVTQSVYNRLADKSTQEELKAIIEQFDVAELALRTKKKLSAIIDKTQEDKPSAPQAALMTVALKLSGDLVERREVSVTKRERVNWQNHNVDELFASLVDRLKGSASNASFQDVLPSKTETRNNGDSGSLSQESA